MLLLILIAFSMTELEADEDLQQLNIVDWHVHVAGLGHGDSDNFINDAMYNNYRFKFFLKWMNVMEEDLEKNGDQIVVKRLNEKLKQSKYIDQAIILALDGVIDKKTGQLDKAATQFYVDNEFVAHESAKYPNLLFGASINPSRPDSIELLDKVQAQGVLTHTGMEKSFPNTNDALADPRRLELALNSGVTVIAAHIATTGESEGQDNFERIMPMFAEFPNLYTEISSLTQINKLGYLAQALKKPGLTKRMIYGTDRPLQSFPPGFTLVPH